MDRHLLERMVGATVLVAAAIILIPEMLSGPRDTKIAATSGGQTATTEDGAVKTYTIDLLAHKPAPDTRVAAAPELPATKSTKETIETTPAPPDETESNATAAAHSVNHDDAPPVTKPPAPTSALAAPISTADSGHEKMRAETSLTKNPLQKNDAVSVVAQKKNEPARSNSAPAVNAGGWAVQLASLGARDSADHMAVELKAKGYAAFVMPFQSNGQTHFRVRVGPMKDRAAAEAELQKVKLLYPQANVVPHS